MGIQFDEGTLVLLSCSWILPQGMGCLGESLGCKSNRFVRCWKCSLCFVAGGLVLE